MLGSFSLNINKRIPSFNRKINIDSDKSISIRSLLIGSISQRISKINNILESGDVFSTIKCLRKLGVKIKSKAKELFDLWKRIRSLTAKKIMKLILEIRTLATIGILTTTPNIELKIRGDHSLNKRSMEKLINLMSSFGAYFKPENKFFFP